MWGSLEWRKGGKKSAIFMSPSQDARKLKHCACGILLWKIWICNTKLHIFFVTPWYPYLTSFANVLQPTSVVRGCMVQHKIIVFSNNFVTCHIHIGQDHVQSNMECSFGTPKCFVQFGIEAICRALYLFNIGLQDNNVHKTR